MPVIKSVLKDIDINEIEHLVENKKNDPNRNHNRKKIYSKKQK